MTTGFGVGLGALQQAINDSKRRSGGSAPGDRLGFMSWKDGETKIVRFLTDEVISAKFAEWVVVNNPKIGTMDFLVNEEKGNFVTKYGGITKDRENGGFAPVSKLTIKGVAAAVARKEIIDPTTGVRKVVDDIQTFDVDGQKYQGRSFVVIKQALKNFWTPLLGAAERRGTLCDCDWAIKRIGASTDTIYIPSPIEPNGDPELEALRDPAMLAQYYGYGAQRNEADPNRFYFCPQTLVEWADFNSSEEWAQRWLTPKANSAPAQQQPPTVGGFPQMGFSQISGPTPGVLGIPVQQSYVAPQVTPPGGAPGYAESHPTTTLNPPAVANVPLPAQGSAPVLSTATGAPVLHQQPVPQPPAAVQKGPWGNNEDEDEAQAVPSTDTDWNKMAAKLMPHLTAQATNPESTPSTP